MSEKRSVFSMPLLYGIARGDCLYLFCFCASLPHMSISRRIVVAVAFHEVDNTPHRETGTEGDNERLKNRDSLIDESHRFSSLI